MRNASWQDYLAVEQSGVFLDRVLDSAAGRAVRCLTGVLLVDLSKFHFIFAALIGIVRVGLNRLLHSNSGFFRRARAACSASTGYYTLPVSE